MNSVRQNNINLKYQRFTPSGCKDIEIRKFEFVANSQLLCKKKGKRNSAVHGAPNASLTDPESG